MSEKIVLKVENDKTIVAKHYKNGDCVGKAMAHCSPVDEFNLSEGCDIALNRLLKDGGYRRNEYKEYKKSKPMKSSVDYCLFVNICEEPKNMGELGICTAMHDVRDEALYSGDIVHVVHIPTGTCSENIVVYPHTQYVDDSAVKYEEDDPFGDRIARIYGYWNRLNEATYEENKEEFVIVKIQDYKELLKSKKWNEFEVKYD